MADSDIITLPKILQRLVQMLPHFFSILRGILISIDQRPDRAAGLGFTLERACTKNPQGIAVSYNDVRLNYTDFNAWVNQLSHYFLHQGLVKGDAVAVYMENRPEILAVSAGLAKIGVGAVMVNSSQTGDILLHSLTLVEVKLVIIGEELKTNFEAVRAKLNMDTRAIYCVADCDTSQDAGKDHDNYRNLMAEIKQSPKHNPKNTAYIKAADPCLYIFTSGTTGLPKASVVSHGRWMKAYGGFGLSALRLKPKDVLFVTLPFYHATAMVVCWTSVLAGSATIAIGRRFSASGFWQESQSHDATAIAYVGELCRYLMDQVPSTGDANQSVTKMIGNGLRPGIWVPFKKRFGIKQVVEIYGSSEGNIGFTNAFNFDNTIGYTPLKYALVDYDKDTGEPLRSNTGFLQRVGKHGTGLLIGEINKSAPFDGYTQKKSTEAVVLHDVFDKGDAWFNTGDILRDLGFNHAQFVDRMGDTYRWKGENVSTTQVETISAGFSAINESVAYGVQIPETNGKAGMITITLLQGAELDGKQLLDYLRDKLPSYAVPVFVRIAAEVVTTGTYKYQKSDLKREAFDISQIDDPILVLLPGDDCFRPLSKNIYQQIIQGELKY